MEILQHSAELDVGRPGDHRRKLHLAGKRGEITPELIEEIARNIGINTEGVQAHADLLSKTPPADKKEDMIIPSFHKADEDKTKQEEEKSAKAKKQEEHKVREHKRALKRKEEKLETKKEKAEEKQRKKEKRQEKAQAKKKGKVNYLKTGLAAALVLGGGTFLYNNVTGADISAGASAVTNEIGGAVKNSSLTTAVQDINIKEQLGDIASSFADLGVEAGESLSAVETVSRSAPFTPPQLAKLNSGITV